MAATNEKQVKTWGIACFLKQGGDGALSGRLLGYLDEVTS